MHTVSAMTTDSPGSPIDHGAVADAVRRIAFDSVLRGRDAASVTKADATAMVGLALSAHDAAHQCLHDAVRRAREAGLSWSDVGQILGISRQAAFQRFGSTSRADGAP